jgi:hypothetical protein
MKKGMPKEQRTPFKDLTFSQKIAYIFGYYKYYALAVIIVAGVIGGTVWYHYKNYYDSVCNIFVVDGKISGYDEMNDAITRGFESYIGIDGVRTRVVIDYNNSLIVQELDNDATVTRAKMITKASVGDVDGYMANSDYITYFSTDGEPFLVDLTEILTADELKKIGEENIIYYTKNDGTQIPVAVNLTNTKLKTDTNLTLETPCYGVVVTATNFDNAVAFIRYAFGM